MSNDLIPFGKYQGQPIESLVSDPQYVDWLLAQDWFKKRHQHLYQVIINNFQEPSETPEHNRLQAMFVDDDFCLMFATKFVEEMAVQPIAEIIEVRYWNFLESQKKYSPQKTGFIPTPISQILKPAVVAEKFFEHKSGDVCFRIGFLKYLTFYVEIKPFVSDDYPAILRQMKRSGAKILFTENFQSKYVSREQFEKILKTENINLAILGEIEKKLPHEIISHEKFIEIVQKIEKAQKSVPICPYLSLFDFEK